MSQEASQVVLQCEDTQQECFVRRFLHRQAWSSSETRVQKIPRGAGSGEQWVRNNLVR
jgi:hypothetical protein